MNRAAEKIIKFKFYYALMDFLVLSVSFVFTFYAMMNLSNINADKLITPVFPFVIFLLLLSILFIFEFNQLYTEDIIRSRSKQLSAVLKSLAAGAFYIFLITLIMMSVDLTEVGILVSAFSAVAFSLLYIVRIEILRGFVMQEKSDQVRILVIGNGSAGKKIIENIMDDSSSRYSVEGVLEDNPGAYDNISGIRNLGTLDELYPLALSGEIDEVIISTDSEPYERIFEIADRCSELNLRTRIASELFKVIPDHFKTETYYGVPLVDISHKEHQAIPKRIADLVLSFLGLLALIPLFIIVAILIKLTSEGPVLYKHERVGLNGRPFQFYKFRSMTVSDEEDPVRKEMMLKFMKEGITQDETAKIVNKKRLTPIGALLRKYSIDELPQLINVLKGDMSLVGPRPSLPYEYENYEAWQKRRVSVIPGCTGVWQITGRSAVSFNESVLLDLFYINRSSLLFDLLIIFRTIPVMLLSRGGK